MKDSWVAGSLADFSSTIFGIAVHSSGDIFVTSGNTLFRVKHDKIALPQIILTLHQGADLRGIVWNGNILYICGYSEHRIMEYSLVTRTLSTLAGNGFGEE